MKVLLVSCGIVLWIGAAFGAVCDPSSSCYFEARAVCFKQSVAELDLPNDRVPARVFSVFERCLRDSPDFPAAYVQLNANAWRAVWTNDPKYHVETDGAEGRSPATQPKDRVEVAQENGGWEARCRRKLKTYCGIQCRPDGYDPIDVDACIVRCRQKPLSDYDGLVAECTEGLREIE